MIPKSAIVPKLISVALLAVLLLWMCLPAAAQSGSTTLTTRVPSHVTLQLEICGKGSVTMDGETYSKSAAISLPRHAETPFTVTPRRGYRIDSVLYNGEDVTFQLRSGIFTAPAAQADATLTVIFVRGSDNPKTGDPFGWILRLWNNISP